MVFYLPLLSPWLVLFRFRFGVLLGVRGVAIALFFLGFGGAMVVTFGYGCSFGEVVLGVGGLSSMLLFSRFAYGLRLCCFRFGFCDLRVGMVLRLWA